MLQMLFVLTFGLMLEAAKLEAQLLTIGPADLETLNYHGGVLRLVCFTQSNQLGRLRSSQLEVGAVIKLIRPAQKLKSLRNKANQLKRRARQVASGKQRRRYRKQLRKITVIRQQLMTAIRACTQDHDPSSLPPSSSGNSSSASSNTPIDVTLANQITQHGITWQFDKQYPVGQFANGDWWVTGPLNITSISPAPICTGETGRNGTMISPAYQTAQGYDSRAYSYDASLCRNDFPIPVQPGDSIISSLSLDEMQSYTVIDHFAVLTVLDRPVTADRFRPPYTRGERVSQAEHDPLLFSLNDVHWEFLPSLPKPPATPDIQNSAAQLRLMAMEHFKGWTQRAISPLIGPPTYGRDISAVVSSISLQLMLDYPVEQKRDAMVNLLQYGIDVYGVYTAGGIWQTDGGIFCGRKWPILFAGIMLGEDDLKYADMPPWRFHEDGQTFFVSPVEVYQMPYRLEQRSDWQTGDQGFAKVVNGSDLVEGIGTIWTDSKKAGPDFWFGIEDDREAYQVNGQAYKVEQVISDTLIRLAEPYRGDTNTSGIARYKLGNRFVWYGHGNESKHLDYLEYTSDHIGMPDWGIAHDRQPVADGLDWDSSYRRCCNANAWSGFILAAHILEEATGAKTIWNHPALFDYQDRYMEVEAQYSGKGSWTREWVRPFFGNMWDTYRAQYGCVWTRHNKADLYSSGFYDCAGAQVECSRITSENDYPNEIARRYDPCQTGTSQ